MTEVHALHFEGRLSGLSKTADGSWNLRLKVHPNETPKTLTEARIGSRWMVALAEIGDDEQPVVDPDRLEAERLVQSAGMLCRDPAFQKWFSERYEFYPADGFTWEDCVADNLRFICGDIESRRELATNPKAAAEFKRIRSAFNRKVR